MGVIAGYFGGWVDALISRMMDIFLAFPLLVFAIALAGVIPDDGLRPQGRHAADRRARSSSSGSSTGPTSAGSSAARRCRCASGSSSTRPAASVRARPYILVQGAAAQPGRADPRLRHAADPDQHPVRGGAVLPRRRRPAAHARPGAACSPTRRSWYQIDPWFMLRPAWRSSSPCWPSTCSATACATRSTHGASVDLTRPQCLYHDHEGGASPA